MSAKKSRPKSPRVPPVTNAALTAEQRQLVGGDHPAGALNIVRTLIQYPALFRAWGPFSSHVMMTNSLSARDREILILRAGVVCQSDYEVAQHTVIARQAGLSDAEIASIREDGAALSEFERTLIKAADELVTDHCISDASWAALSKRYTREQLMDLIFTVANYTLVSMALNSLGVQIEPEIEKFWKKLP